MIIYPGTVSRNLPFDPGLRARYGLLMADGFLAQLLLQLRRLRLLFHVTKTVMSE